MRRFEIEHVTRFAYSGPISETIMEVRLEPVDGQGQRCLEFDLEVSPKTRVGSYRDGYGNSVHYFNILRAHERLQVKSRSLVETGLEVPPIAGDLVFDFLRFRSPVVDVAGVRALAAGHQPSDLTSGAAVETAIEDLVTEISRDFAYDPAVTNVHTGVDEVLELRAGVCQDFAHLLIAAARAMGVPARYVSGYIYVPGESGVTEGASHAWAEAWIPGRGWVGYDATHPIRAGENHVRIAVGRDYRDAAPTRGVYVGAATGTMNVSVRTRTLDPDSGGNKLTG
ncbi:MAG: transglutaminase family protein [Candidatus Dormibacteraceae bacterium]